MIPTYVLNSVVHVCVMIVTRELDSERVEVMYLVNCDQERVGTYDWVFRSYLEDPKAWTRIA